MRLKIDIAVLIGLGISFLNLVATQNRPQPVFALLVWIVSAILLGTFKRFDNRLGVHICKIINLASCIIFWDLNKLAVSSVFVGGITNVIIAWVDKGRPVFLKKVVRLGHQTTRDRLLDEIDDGI